jgi:hypothetical protein
MLNSADPIDCPARRKVGEQPDVSERPSDWSDRLSAVLRSPSRAGDRGARSRIQLMRRGLIGIAGVSAPPPTLMMISGRGRARVAPSARGVVFCEDMTGELRGAFVHSRSDCHVALLHLAR